MVNQVNQTNQTNQVKQVNKIERIDHDGLFKQLLSAFFFQFLQLFFPELAAQIDPDSIVMMNKELTEKGRLGGKHIADLVVRAKLRDEDSFFIIHGENESQSRGTFPRRMFHYFADLDREYNLPIYPIVVFSYDAPMKPAEDQHIVKVAGFKVMEFNYKVVQLNQLNWRDFLDSTNPIVSALMAKMNVETDDRPEAKLECLRKMVASKLDSELEKIISLFIDTYLKLNAAEEEILHKKIEAIESEEKGGIMRMVTSWMERGLEQGLERGLEQGLEQGRHKSIALVTKMLVRKFGTIAVSTRKQIDQLSFDQLENLAEAILDFHDKSDLIAWLKQNK